MQTEGVGVGKRNIQKMPRAMDPGTVERRAKGKFELEGTEEPHFRFADATKLDWYLSHNFIDATQHHSGLRFRADFLIAGWQYRIVGGYAEWTDKGSSSVYAPDVRMDAKDRVKCALMALPLLVIPVVVAVCGVDEWGLRKVKDLVVGLDALTEHYEGRRR